MTDAGITFAKEAEGYNKAQVESYIRKIGDAYQATYNEYRELAIRHEAALEENKRLKAQERTGPGSEVIAKTLVSTEILAKKIIDDAHAQAELILADSQRTKLGIEQARQAMERAAAEATRILSQGGFPAGADAQIGLRLNA